MRQVFSSARLENVEAVAKLLEDAGIEVRVTEGRSYKGNLRSRSYTEQDAPKPAVWVVKSEDQVRAREILREAGLIDSTRPGESFITPTFRSEAPVTAKTPAQKRAFRLKLGLLAAIVVIIALAMVRTFTQAPEEESQPAAVQTFDGRAAPTPESLALVVFARELTDDKLVLCLAIDGEDAPAAVIAGIGQPSNTVVPASQCVRVFDPETGSHHAPTGRPALLAEVRAFRPTAADAGTVEFEAFHHGQFARYKTLEVRRVQGAWQVVRVIRHVAS
jgi:hypothetical protein